MSMNDDLFFEEDDEFIESPQNEQPEEPINPQEPEEDLTTEVLKLRGISDPEKIKFEDETGAVTERSWSSLTKEERLNILAGEFEDDENSLSDSEINLLNTIRDSGLSVEEYLNSLQQPAPQQQSYKIDELSDEEVYALDLLEKIGSDNITDEELQSAVNAAKQNENVFKKQVESLRKEYIKLQEDEEARAAQEQAIRYEEAYNKFATSIQNEINDLTSFAGQDLELSKEDTEELTSFMLNLDDNGVSEFGKKLQNPKVFTEAAFWILYKDQIIEELSKQMQNNYKKGFEAGKLDAAKSTPVVVKPTKQLSTDHTFVDDDDWY